MPKLTDFELETERPDLSPALSGIFTYGVDALDFNARELRRFNEVACSLNPEQAPLSAVEVAALARRVMRSANANSEAPFIASRQHRVTEIRAMAADPMWRSDPLIADRIRNLLAYIDSPGLFNDATPVIGHLDDALLVDFAMDGLRPELELYAAFCSYRLELAAQTGTTPEALHLDRDTWLAEHADGKRLQRQWRRVHEASYSEGEPDHPFHIH